MKYPIKREISSTVFLSLSLSLLSKGRGVRDDYSSGFVDSRIAED